MKIIKNLLNGVYYTTKLYGMNREMKKIRNTEL